MGSDYADCVKCNVTFFIATVRVLYYKLSRRQCDSGSPILMTSLVTVVSVALHLRVGSSKASRNKAVTVTEMDDCSIQC